MVLISRLIQLGICCSKDRQRRWSKLRIEGGLSLPGQSRPREVYLYADLMQHWELKIQDGFLMSKTHTFFICWRAERNNNPF